MERNSSQQYTIISSDLSVIGEVGLITLKFIRYGPETTYHNLKIYVESDEIFSIELDGDFYNRIQLRKGNRKIVKSMLDLISRVDPSGRTLTKLKQFIVKVNDSK